MIRLMSGAVLALFVSVTAASGDEVKGTIKSVDSTKNTIVVTTDGKNTTLAVSKDASIVTVTMVPGKKNKVTEKLTPIENGLTGVKVGANVTLLTDKVDDKDTVTSVKVSDGKAAPAAALKKKKKKKKNT
jgi:hypothetical protein